MNRKARNHRYSLLKLTASAAVLSLALPVCAFAQTTTVDADDIEVGPGAVSYENLTIGYYGSASVTTKPATILTINRGLFVGMEPNSDGALTVDGAGSELRLNLGNDPTSVTQFGYSGEATLNITNGAVGTINSRVELALGANATTTINVEGAGSRLTFNGANGAPSVIGSGEGYLDINVNDKGHLDTTKMSINFGSTPGYKRFTISDATWDAGRIEATGESFFQISSSDDAIVRIDNVDVLSAGPTEIATYTLATSYGGKIYANTVTGGVASIYSSYGGELYVIQDSNFDKLSLFADPDSLIDFGGNIDVTDYLIMDISGGSTFRAGTITNRNPNQVAILSVTMLDKIAQFEVEAIESANLNFNIYSEVMDDDFVFDLSLGNAANVFVQGPGKSIFTGNNTYTGNTTVSGTNDSDVVLQIGNGGITGNITSDISVSDASVSLNRSSNFQYDGQLYGTGRLLHEGSGITRLTFESFQFTGDTIVNNGTLIVDGGLAGNVQVNNATLGGAGIVGAVTSVGGTLLGVQDDTLLIDGDLTMDAATQMNVSIGQPGAVAMFYVSGDLVLDGTVNVHDIGGFGPGLYRLIDYSGTLTDNGLEVGTLPSGVPSNQVAVQLAANEVNLFSQAGLQLHFWDGTNTISNGIVEGGSGIWNFTDTNWTEAEGLTNGPWDETFAIFQGAAGTVTVDGSLGAVRAQGMQFTTDGYVVDGDAITLTEANSIIRVGAGLRANRMGTTATIASKLAGNAAVVKTDLGTLILEGQNTYAGGTVVEGGVLQISSDANLGAAAGSITLDGGTLRNTAAMTTGRAVTIEQNGGIFDTRADLTINGVISGPDGLTKTGSGTLILAANNTYGEGTIIDAGAVQLGNGGTAGWVQGDVTNNGSLIFNRSNAATFAGNISGSGSLMQNGSGTTTLTGDASHLLGDHVISNGGLIVNSELGGDLLIQKGLLGGTGIVGDTTLEAAGIIAPGNSIGTLTIDGNFVGNGGLIQIESVLGDDTSATDLLAIRGNATGTARMQVINLGGAGAPTVQGIKVVDIGGASDATFSLQSDYIFDGDQAVVGGAYAYRLYKGGVATPDDGDWYLRSALVDGETDPDGPDPKPPLYQAGVPVYEAYPQALLGLNGLNTLQQRVGNRNWAQGAHSANTYGLDGPQRNGAWARLEGGHTSLRPNTSTTGSKFRQNDVFLQGGYDRVLGDNDSGAFVLGANLNTAYGRTKVRSPHGDGHIKTEGFGVGASATWYGTNGMYVDAQAQHMWYRSDLTSGLVSEKLVRRNRGTGYALSGEIGRSYAMGAGWTWTPQAQLTYSSVDFKDFTDPFDARVKMDRGDEFTGRVGLGISRETAWRGQSGKMSRAQYYGIANVNYDFDSARRVDVDAVRISASIPRLSADIGVGGTYSWDDDRFAIYGQGSVGTYTDDFGNSNDLRGQIGFKMRW